ncbi:Cysteine proteinase ACP1 [Entamoeba marina]
MLLFLSILLIVSASEIQFKNWCSLVEDAQKRGLMLELNVFADLTHDEFVNTRLGKPITVLEDQDNLLLESSSSSEEPLPESVDLRNIMRSIKDQGDCSASWAFCTTATMEGRAVTDLNMWDTLSEQQLLDCDPYDNGCSGGHPYNAMKYVSEYVGLTSEENYPYQGKVLTCNLTVNGIISVYNPKKLRRGEDKIMESVAKTGPVAIQLDGSQPSFQLIGPDTIYVEPNCKKYILNMCTTVVGYGTSDDGVDYWLLRGSFGEGFGDNGYFKLRRGTEECGVGYDSTIPRSMIDVNH